jgi:hypothetical protein
MAKHNTVEWPEPWYEIVDMQQRVMLTRELNQELG